MIYSIKKFCCDRRVDIGSSEVFFFSFKMDTLKPCFYVDGNGFRVREKLMVQEIERIISGQLSLNRQEG